MIKETYISYTIRFLSVHFFWEFQNKYSTGKKALLVKAFVLLFNHDQPLVSLFPAFFFSRVVCYSSFRVSLRFLTVTPHTKFF